MEALASVFELRKVLAPSTLVAFARLYAASSFENDFRSLFERAEIIGYLQLTPSQLDQLKLIANSEKVKLSREVAKVEENTFFELSSKLTADRRADIESLFKDVWTFGN